MAWTYSAYRATTKTPLDLDLPLDVEEVEWALSGAGALRATVSPDIGQMRASDGRLLLEEWGTILLAVDDRNGVRWGGIVIASAFEGEAWHVEAAGISSYPHGMAYMTNYSKIGVDPAQVVRDIWAHLQAQPDGDLDVTVNGATPVRLGKPGIPATPQVYLGGKWYATKDVDADKIEVSTSVNLAVAMTKTDTSLTLTSIGNYANIGLPFEVKVGSERITVTGRSGAKLTGLTRGVGTSVPASHGKGTAVKYTGTPTRTLDAVPAEPYTLPWYEAPDCGEEIDSLATETPFDYVEKTAWVGEGFAHTIEIGYPRLGTRRTDLSFVQGDNVTNVVTPSISGDDYANVVLGIGAGEGTKTIHRTAAVRDGRLRRTAVYTAKAVTSNARMDWRVRDQLAKRRNVLEVSEITVADHPNARIGSWALGDDILVEATIPWLGDIAVWSRVVGWSLLPDGSARLALKRSDSFTYGG